MRRIAITVGMAVAVLLTTATPAASQQVPDGFPHEKHATGVPFCATCHASVTDSRVSPWPDPRSCAACHDGTVKPRISWQPRVGPRHGNRRFTHEGHLAALIAANPADSAVMENCSACHVPDGEQRMTVRNAVVPQCFACHGYGTTHFEAPPEACATCHVRLTDAPTLTAADIRRFPEPQSHRTPDFVLGGHGRLAKSSAASGTPIAASCATCHARNLCLSCHVNAPESPQIQALVPDGRVPVSARTQPVPSIHRAAGFLRAHGGMANRNIATCAVCHAQQSCQTCHVGVLPGAVARLAPGGEGRAPGALLVRTPPSTHTRSFVRDRHGPEANARVTSCETCHARSTCLECHRPDATRQNRYHPASFLTRHPSSAFSREATCTDCHNTAQFCQSCHQRSGLTASARLGRAGYHDAFRGFSLGHGQAARQNLESCATCHAERDCTACHSAVGGGFRFNPHGPGFNAERMRAKNPSVCIACHGTARKIENRD
jgi:hypothetical protein